MNGRNVLRAANVSVSQILLIINYKYCHNDNVGRLFHPTADITMTFLITKLLKITVTKQDNTGHKIYIRHIPLNVNSVHRLNIKYIGKH